MNKKFSTLMAMALMASSVNGWAQVKIDADCTSGNGAYKVQKSDYAGFNQFVREDASMRTNGNFPTVSPFEIATKYGAKPISELQYVNGVSDGRYFQFVVGTTYEADEGGTKKMANATTDCGGALLTMVWVNTSGTMRDDGSVLGEASVSGHYEIQIEDVNNANVPNNPIRLDRTLWKVTAHKDAAGTTLYYELQNKASQAILQLSRDNVDGTGTAHSGSTTAPAQAIKLKIVNGQTNWRWAAAQKAAIKSNLHGETDYKVLQNTLTAQYDNNETIHLARKVDKDNHVTLGAVKMNSSVRFSEVGDYVEIGTDKYYPIVFEGWEANPIVLTADQINAELGNEDLLTEDQKTKNKFHFEFENDVLGDVNVMTASDFKAVGPAKGNNAEYYRLPGDTPDGYVRFLKNGTDNQYLHVDTAYHDAAANTQYALKMTVGQILYPRDAVSQDKLNVNSNGALIDPTDGHTLTDKEIYGDGNVDTKADYTARAYVQLKRQSNFRPIFYPATQSLRLQAEMIYRADKRIATPWWQQMAEDAMTATNSDRTSGSSIGTNGYMRIAEFAANPNLNVVSRPSVVRGYYPSYTQNVNYATGVPTQGLRLIHYALSWKPTDLTDPAARNGYAPQGAWDYTNSNDATNNHMLWNAVGNVALTKGRALEATSTWLVNSSTSNQNVWVLDPAAASVGTMAYVGHNTASPNTVQSSTTASALCYAPQFALAHSNLVRLATLTSTHRVLTADVHDTNDTEYNGLYTYITLKTVKTEPGLDEVAEIPEGFYYIRNAKAMTSDLTKYGDYRYEDLAATNAMFAYWNAQTQKWDRGTSSVDTPDGPTDITGMDTDRHAKDRSNIGNLVYSTDKKVIPSAQWYVKGNGGYYTIINRESGRTWGTSYWWKTDKENVYANMATYIDGNGLQQTYRDTIMIEAIPASELTDRYMGYLNMTQEEAKADTLNYGFGMKTWSEERYSLADVDGKLKLVADAKGDYKLERVQFVDKDIYSQVEKPKDEFIYGFVPELPVDPNDKNAVAAVDTSKMLIRAKYFIYKDEVSANSGIEPSSIMTRKYITLESGDYKLTPIKVQDVNGDGYTTNLEADEIANTEGVKVRRAFYIKQISTEDPTQYVIVDPMVVTQTQNGTSTKVAYGARLFANQNTAYVQPASLISNGYANAYASSIFTVEKKEAYNYADIRPAGVARDTVEFYSAKTDGQYLLSENGNVKGAHVGLFESLDKLMNKNNAMFLDTANVAYPECPRFLIGVRSKDKFEESNIDGHNRHLYTDADYLVNLVDSAATNKTYVYQNQDFNATKYYRLGFVSARHYGDVRFGEEGKPSTLKIAKTGKVYDLGNATLGDTGLNIATFAFRYPNANRDLEEGVYIETMYDHNTRGWLKTINHILVVTPNIQEADLFKVNTETTDVPTANEEITAEGNVIVAGTNGAVVVKGAEGKNVIVSTILGKVVANEVVSSDNATIAAPAGVVVVSVDGESFKVVVK